MNIEICHEVGLNEVLHDGIDRDSGNVFFSYSVQFRVITHCEPEKNCPILIILSLLQTQINYDHVYSTVHHQTSYLLVQYKIHEFIGSHCWLAFVIEDVTVKSNQYCEFTSCTQNVLR